MGHLGNTKPTLNIVTLGHSNHGKTALFKAISNELGRGKMESYQGIANASTEYQSGSRSYRQFDASSNQIARKLLIPEGVRFDAAILVVSATNGPMPETREHLIVARETDISRIVVFISHGDQLDERNKEEVIEEIEMEIRQLISSYEYDDDIEMVNGSAFDSSTIRELVKVMDDQIPEATSLNSRNFLMPIGNIVKVADNQTSIKGKVERGILAKGKRVSIIANGKNEDIVVKEIKKSGQSVSQGETGDNIEVLFSGTYNGSTSSGVLAHPNSIRLMKSFKGIFYMFTKAEGGQNSPIYNNCQASFNIMNSSTTGVMKLPEDIEKIYPGDYVTISIDLNTSTGMETGASFQVEKDGKTIGIGRIIALLG